MLLSTKLAVRSLPAPVGVKAIVVPVKVEAEPVSPKVKAPVPPAATTKAASALSSAEVKVTVPESFRVKVKVASAASAMSILSELAPITSPPVTVKSPKRTAFPASVIEKMSVPPEDCSINKALLDPVRLVLIYKGAPVASAS